MAIESICKKTIAGDKDKLKVEGRLFYAIVLNQKRKLIELYFSNINTEEARSVTHGLPLFV